MLVKLLGSRLLALAFELDKEHPMIGRDKEPIWCVAFMEFVHEAAKGRGRSY